MRPLILFNPNTGQFYHKGKPLTPNTVEEFVILGLMVPVGEGENKIVAQPADSEYVLGDGVVLAEE